MPPLERWDIFCRVVDNYGDAGVCFRLARQLAAEHALDVTLWIDEPATLARIAGGIDPQSPLQRAAGVTLRRLTSDLAAFEPAQVVVEAFGCGLPDGYVEAMARRRPAPAWLILEYLSAEPWVDAAHGLASPHPASGLARRFWFPGFTARTGGLLRERGLFAARDALAADPRAQRHWWQSMGLPPVAGDEIRISLFCYDAAPLEPLLDAWAAGAARVVCVVPEGVAAAALARWTRGRPPRPGTPLECGGLRLHAMPFVAQDDYDRLLWLSSLNFVRGEDSFVRAQWASRTLVWHIYPQADAAHRAKLEAFLARYAEGADPAAGDALRGLWRTWNAFAGSPPLDRAWLDYVAARPHLDRHARRWAETLAGLPELAAGLVRAAHDAV